MRFRFCFFYGRVFSAGGQGRPPSNFVDFSWLFVGADAYIGPSKCCDFASDFRKNGQFRRADRVVRPYGAQWESTRIRRKTTIKRAFPAGRCGHRPLRRRMGKCCVCEVGCRGRCLHRPIKMLRIRIGSPQKRAFLVGRCGHRPLRRRMGKCCVCEVGCRGRCLHRPAPAQNGRCGSFLHDPRGFSYRL